MTISLKDVGSGYKRSAINSNFQAIEDEINNNLLSKNGGVGLEATLDANSQRIINLANGVQGKDAVNLEQLNAILSANSTGIIASQLEVQYGDQAINRVFTFSNIAYVQGGNNLFVFRNGQKLGISEDYTETSTGSITLTFDPNDDDRFEFITNISLTTTLETTSSNVTHSRAGVNSPLATYLNDISLDFDTLADAVACPFLIDGDTVTLKERTSGNGGGAVWDVVLASTVTPNTYNIVQCTGVGTLALVLRVDAVIYADRLGINSGGSDASGNDSVLAHLVTYATSFSVGERPVIEWPEGEIAYTTSPNWGHSDLKSRGAGSGGTRFTYSGSGAAWNIDPSATDTNFRYGISHKGFSIDCGSSATHGVYEENIAHSSYEDVIVFNGANATCIHWEQALTVLNSYKDCGSPINRFTIATNPSECLRLAASPSKLQNTTANTYTNWIAEGATTGGIRLINADVNTFIGGTSESNAGRGVLIATACRNNTFIGLDMEANTVEDFNDAGQSTVWDNCLATSASGAAISGSSVLSKIRGGYYESLTVESGAKGAVVEDVQVNVNGSGGITNNATNVVLRNIYDKTAASFVTANVKDDRGSITVGASPFTYTNTSQQLQQVLVRSGTVDLVTWGRDGDTVLLGAAAEGTDRNGSFLLSPGDSLEVTYTVAPTMNYIPMGTQSI